MKKILLLFYGVDFRGSGHMTHAIIDCLQLKGYRDIMILSDNESLTSYIERKRTEGFTRSSDILKQFLGEDGAKTSFEFNSCAMILENMRDFYISSWKSAHEWTSTMLKDQED